MRWPWSRRPSLEGSAARERAEERLQKEREKTRDVAQLAGELREMRRKNHFAEAIGKAMGLH